jgi:hypothetical protein
MMLGRLSRPNGDGFSLLTALKITDIDAKFRGYTLSIIRVGAEEVAKLPQLHLVACLSQRTRNSGRQAVALAVVEESI